MFSLKLVQRTVAALVLFAMIFSMTGCGRLRISREIATVNNNVITEPEFKYYLENVKQQMLQEAGKQEADASFWDTTEIDGEKASEVAKKKALEELIRVEIAVIKAEEKGLTVSEATMKQIDSLLSTTNAEQKKQVDDIKSKTGLSGDQFREVFRKSTLASQLKGEISTTEPDKVTPTEAAIMEEYNKEYVRVKHVLISTKQEDTASEEPAGDEVAATDETTATPDAEAEAKAQEEYKASRKKVAEDVLAKAKSGANFDSLVTQYGEDPGAANSPNGYTFTKGAMMPEFEAASYALAVGQISDLVETDYGFHIIKRYDLLSSGEDYDKNIETIKSKVSEDMYNQWLDSFQGEFNIKLNQSNVDSIKVK